MNAPRFPVLKIAALCSSVSLFSLYLAYQAGCALPYITRSPSATAAPKTDSPQPAPGARPTMVLSGTKSAAVFSPGESGVPTTAAQEAPATPPVLMPGSKFSTVVLTPPADSKAPATQPTFLISGSKSFAPVIVVPSSASPVSQTAPSTSPATSPSK